MDTKQRMVSALGIRGWSILANSLFVTGALTITACESHPLEPDPALDPGGTPTFAKGGKPGKPGDDPPPPADPAIIYGTYVNKRVQGQQLSWSIHVMNADGTNQTRVFSNSEERGVSSLMPHFSPDGAQFVFKRSPFELDPYRSEIATANLDGSGLTTVLATQDGVEYPRWSPVALGDGRFKISFSNLDVFVVNLEGSGLTQLTNSPASWGYYEGALWSPLADRLVTVARDTDANEYHVLLYGIDCAGGCQITSTSEIDLSAWLSTGDAFIPRDWSNIGNRIVGEVPFSHAGNADLWVLDVTDPANPGFMQLTSTPGLNENHPTWSPADSQIAYSGYPVNRDRSAFVMNADGTGVQVIAEVGNEWGIDWRPTP